MDTFVIVGIIVGLALAIIVIAGMFIAIYLYGRSRPGFNITSKSTRRIDAVENNPVSPSENNV